MTDVELRFNIVTNNNNRWGLNPSSVD